MGATKDFALISDEDIKNMRVDKLHTELKKRGLGRGGLKGDLAEMIQQEIIDKVPIKNDQANEVAKKNVFAEGDYWKVIDTKDTDIDDPTTRNNLNAPTVGNDKVTVVKKRNYAHVFDRAPFSGTIEVDKLGRYKRRRVNPVTKKIL